MTTMLKNDARVLLIESDPGLQHTLAQMLQSHYPIEIATYWETACILDRERTADLILAGVMTDRPDSKSLVHEIRRSPQLHSIPIIVYGSPASEELCLEAMEAGANDYLITTFSERQ